MTEREKQILGWIQQNPMITQQEIAKKAGITRACVGVHISHLMKQGEILGKGYLFREDTPFVCAVGGANVDIIGTPYAHLRQHDSCPGKTVKSLGGVSRNICENLSRLGVKTELITVLGEDSYAQMIRENCGELGIGISHSIFKEKARTSTYLCINDENGEMKHAVADMDIYQFITPEYLFKKRAMLHHAKACVVDTNIPEETLAALMEDGESTPLFMDTVSIQKTKKLSGFLKNIYALKPNKMEAEMLSGVTICTEQDLREAAKRILAQGVREVFISLGSDGVFYMDHQQSGFYSCIPAQVKSTTGAGDSFMAGIVWAYLNGLDVQQAAIAGTAAASITVSSVHTVSHQMEESILLNKINKESQVS